MCVYICMPQVGRTALHSAALGGHKEVAEMVLRAGAEVSAKDGVHEKEYVKCT